MLIHQEDNMTPPGFAAAVVHHTPHQLLAMLACQRERAKLCRLQLLTHACQQPASDVQVHHQQPASTSTKPACMLAVNLNLMTTKKK
jgi:hypothetical protein